MNLRTKILAALAGSLGLLWLTPAFAYNGYQYDVPNGTVYNCQTCHNSSGGGGHNALYNEIYPSSPNWSSLYNQDADGDGQTNGQELGDPCGNWTSGATPQYTTGLSNPGVASDTNSIPACAPVDNTPPTVSITAPSSGQTVSGSITVTANASDNVGVSKVDFFVDGQSIGTVTTAPWQTSWSTTNASNGSHTITADAYDAAGNKGTSQSVSVTVNNQSGGTDTTPPTVSLAAPTNGQTVSGNAVLLKASASDNVGVVRVDFLVAGRAVASISSAPWQFSWDSTAIADGTYTLQAKAYDAAGNVGTSSNVSITVNNSGPVATDGGTPGTDGGTPGTDGGTPGGGNDGGTPGNPGGGTDTTPPEVALTSPSAGATLSGTATVTASATDNVGVTRVDFLVDGAIVASVLAPPYTATFDTHFFANGSHTLSAAAYDAMFNQGLSQGISVTISNESGTTGGGVDGGTGGGADGGTGGADGGVGGNTHPQPLGGCAVSPGRSSSAFIALFLLAGGLMVIRKRW